MPGMILTVLLHENPPPPARRYHGHLPGPGERGRLDEPPSGRQKGDHEYGHLMEMQHPWKHGHTPPQIHASHRADALDAPSTSQKRERHSRRLSSDETMVDSVPTTPRASRSCVTTHWPGALEQSWSHTRARAPPSRDSTTTLERLPENPVTVPSHAIANPRHTLNTRCRSIQQARHNGCFLNTHMVRSSASNAAMPVDAPCTSCSGARRATSPATL